MQPSARPMSIWARPLLVGLHWWRSRQRGIALQDENAVEISFLALASLYAFVIVLKGSIGLIDFVALLVLYGFYLRRTLQLPKVDEDEEDEEPGPGAIIASMSPGSRWTVMGLMAVTAMALIVLSAEPFAESLIQALGSDTNAYSDAESASPLLRALGRRQGRPNGYLLILD